VTQADTLASTRAKEALHGAQDTVAPPHRSWVSSPQGAWDSGEIALDVRPPMRDNRL